MVAGDEEEVAVVGSRRRRATTGDHSFRVAPLLVARDLSLLLDC